MRAWCFSPGPDAAGQRGHPVLMMLHDGLRSKDVIEGAARG